MAEIAVGIDLGTSNSCVAVSRGGTVEVLANGYGENITASVVAFRQDGTITVGNAAKANIIHDPQHTVYSAKRLIGRYFFSEEVKKARAICSYDIVEAENHGLRLAIRDETFSLPEISAMVLREMKAIAEARLGQPVAKAVVTVPAYFNDNQRQATKDAGRIAGLEVLRILNEPTAAALAYGFGRGLSQRVAVYDLGGGTFDISVLEIGDDVFEVLASCGDTFLGGDDFDDRLIDLLAEEFMAREGINLRNDRFALEKLKVAAEGAKKGLSVEPEVDIRIPDVIEGPNGALSIERHLTTEEYAGLVKDLIQRTFKVCDEALQQASMVARDLDGVVLVGGPTRLPLLRDAVRAYFQQEPKSDVDPDQVVAMGASIHASSLINPDQDAYLLDVTPLSLCIGVAGGLSEPVIERNTPVPIEQTRTFTTFKDFQKSVSIRVYQGESREAEENEPLGQFEFSGFEQGRRGEVEIDVTFEINADGIVEVTARDRKTGQQASTRITLSSGLSEGELQEIIQRGRTDRVESATEAPALRTQRDQVVEGLAALPLGEVDPPEARPAPVPPGAPPASAGAPGAPSRLDVATDPILDDDPLEVVQEASDADDEALTVLPFDAPEASLEPAPEPLPEPEPEPAPAPTAPRREPPATPRAAPAFDEAPTDERSIFSARAGVEEELEIDDGDLSLEIDDDLPLLPEDGEEAPVTAVTAVETPTGAGRAAEREDAPPGDAGPEPLEVALESEPAEGAAIEVELAPEPLPRPAPAPAPPAREQPEEIIELTESLHIDVSESTDPDADELVAPPAPATVDVPGGPADFFEAPGGDLSSTEGGDAPEPGPDDPEAGGRA